MRFLLNVTVPNKSTTHKLLQSRKRAVPNNVNLGPNSKNAGGATSSSQQEKLQQSQSSAAATNSPLANTATDTTFSRSSDTANEEQSKNQDTIQSWGQQCSPNCGCTVRFETIIDPTNHYQIVSASYHAKTVVSKKVHVTKSPIQYENGFKTLVGSSPTANNSRSSFLQPILTQSPGMTSNNTVSKTASGPECDRTSISSTANPSSSSSSRPLLKPCHCKTLHSLAKNIVQILPRYSLSQAQNQLEFSGSRSSPSFRYTVLKNLDLITVDNHVMTSDTSASTNNVRNESLDINNIPQAHCYDLVEDALMACLHGYIPKPRNHAHATGPIQLSPMDYDDYDDCRYQRIHHDQHEDKGLDPLRYVRAAKQRAANRSNGYEAHASSSNAFMPTEQQDTFSFPSSSSSSSSLFSLSSMPSFHWMMNSSHDDGSHHPVDTLTQLKFEIRSMKEHDGNKSSQQENVKSNDWVSYVDEKYS
eukprot:CAMPEP_0176478106 /NCGR_PEP_ID=MMETSP0200_2-20121128/1006_1 /TAXON_ID=947934 /ORGANISM="Chaetoceros sp., Strain GSL56" /LENGTH=473 /DNA_ID=CAMNT_0017874015 /DNA_START=213 /DNA_END=1634 /DNA_ORIENTATION=-